MERTSGDSGRGERPHESGSGAPPRCKLGICASCIVKHFTFRQQLNGANGEFTGTDDMPGKGRKGTGKKPKKVTVVVASSKKKEKRKVGRARRTSQLHEQAVYLKNDPVASKLWPKVIRGRGDYTVGKSIGSELGGRIGDWAERFFRKIFGSGDYKVDVDPQHGVTQNSAFASSEMSTLPSFGGPGDAVPLRFHEFIQEISMSVNFAIQSYQIDPVDQKVFPWMYVIALCFQQWRLKGGMFVIRSLTPEVTVGASVASMGSIVGAITYDTSAPVPTDKASMMNMMQANSTKPSLNMVIPIECRAKETLGPLKTARPGIPIIDPQLYRMGRFDLATLGAPNAYSSAAELHVIYDIEFYKQATLASSPMRFYHADLGAVTWSAPLALVADSPASVQPRYDSIGIKLDSARTKMYFPASLPSGSVYALVYSVQGTAAANEAFFSLTYSNGFAAKNSLNNQAATLMRYPDTALNTGCGVIGAVNTFVYNGTGTVAAPPTILFSFNSTTIPTSITGGTVFVFQLPSSSYNGLTCTPPEHLIGAYSRSNFLEYLSFRLMGKEEPLCAPPGGQRYRLRDWTEFFKHVSLFSPVREDIPVFPAPEISVADAITVIAPLVDNDRSNEASPLMPRSVVYRDHPELKHCDPERLLGTMREKGIPTRCRPVVVDSSDEEEWQLFKSRGGRGERGDPNPEQLGTPRHRRKESVWNLDDRVERKDDEIDRVSKCLSQARLRMHADCAPKFCNERLNGNQGSATNTDDLAQPYTRAQAVDAQGKSLSILTAALQRLEPNVTLLSHNSSNPTHAKHLIEEAVALLRNLDLTRFPEKKKEETQTHCIEPGCAHERVGGKHWHCVLHSSGRGRVQSAEPPLTIHPLESSGPELEFVCRQSPHVRPQLNGNQGSVTGSDDVVAMVETCALSAMCRISGHYHRRPAKHQKKPDGEEKKKRSNKLVKCKKTFATYCDEDHYHDDIQQARGVASDLVFDSTILKEDEDNAEIIVCGADSSSDLKVDAVVGAEDHKERSIVLAPVPTTSVVEAKPQVTHIHPLRRHYHEHLQVDSKEYKLICKINNQEFDEKHSGDPDETKALEEKYSFGCLPGEVFPDEGVVEQHVHYADEIPHLFGARNTSLRPGNVTYSPGARCTQIAALRSIAKWELRPSLTDAKEPVFVRKPSKKTYILTPFPNDWCPVEDCLNYLPCPLHTPMPVLDEREAWFKTRKDIADTNFMQNLVIDYLRKCDSPSFADFMLTVFPENCEKREEGDVVHVKVDLRCRTWYTKYYRGILPTDVHRIVTQPNLDDFVPIPVASPALSASFSPSLANQLLASYDEKYGGLPALIPNGYATPPNSPKQSVVWLGGPGPLGKRAHDSDDEDGCCLPVADQLLGKIFTLERCGPAADRGLPHLLKERKPPPPTPVLSLLRSLPSLNPKGLNFGAPLPGFGFGPVPPRQALLNQIPGFFQKSTVKIFINIKRPVRPRGYVHAAAGLVQPIVPFMHDVKVPVVNSQSDVTRPEKLLISGAVLPMKRIGFKKTPRHEWEHSPFALARTSDDVALFEGLYNSCFDATIFKSFFEHLTDPYTELTKVSSVGVKGVHSSTFMKRALYLAQQSPWFKVWRDEDWDTTQNTIIHAAQQLFRDGKKAAMCTPSIQDDSLDFQLLGPSRT
jgi:hypothetical protein